MTSAGPVGLTPRTAEKVREWIAKRPGPTAAGLQDAGSRQTKFIKVTGSVSSGWYPCVVTQQLNDGTWADLSMPCECHGVDGQTLTSSQRYTGWEIGVNSANSKTRFVVGGEANFTHKTGSSEDTWIGGSVSTGEQSIKGAKTYRDKLTQQANVGTCSTISDSGATQGKHGVYTSDYNKATGAGGSVEGVSDLSGRSAAVVYRDGYTAELGITDATPGQVTLQFSQDSAPGTPSAMTITSSAFFFNKIMQVTGSVYSTGVVTSEVYFSVKSLGTTYLGTSGTISYTKPGGGTGSILVQGGIIWFLS